LKGKKREIYYSDHLDSQIYAYYSFLLSQKLEEIYSSNEVLNSSVIAYRSIPFNKFRSKCNIDFAKEVFDFISESKGTELSVLCFDITSFFDSLNHKILKKSWYNMLGSTSLSDDHYKVYKAITKFTYVEISDLIDEFSELKINKLQYLKRRNIVSFCKSGEEFRERVDKKGLIRYNKFDLKKGCVRDCGIPQGSPISAVLSNLYLLDLDKTLSAWAEKLGGLYRRYSDDLLFVCSPTEVESIKNYLVTHVKDDLNLVIQKEKTQEVFFKRSNHIENWLCCTMENGIEKIGRPLSYLGFDFDGQNTRVRQKSLSQYYRKLKRMIRRRAKYAYYAKLHNEFTESNPRDSWIYRQRIYKSKSHLGSKKKRIDGKVFWGNYISYINTASKAMNEPMLKKQIRNHWRIIEREIAEWEKLYELTKTPSKRKKI